MVYTRGCFTFCAWFYFTFFFLLLPAAARRHRGNEICASEYASCQFRNKNVGIWTASASGWSGSSYEGRRVDTFVVAKGQDHTLAHTPIRNHKVVKQINKQTH